MSLYLLMGILPLTLQVGCAVHALKTGRSYYWLWIILFFPAAGALVYFFVEILPELRHGSAFDGASSGLFRAIHPERELTRLKDQLEICDSHANRVALAQEYVRLGQFDAAIPLFRRSLTGLYKDDPDALFGLAEACFLGASYAEARQILAQLMRLHTNYRIGECRLLLAQNLGMQRRCEFGIAGIRISDSIGHRARSQMPLCFAAEENRPNRKGQCPFRANPENGVTLASILQKNPIAMGRNRKKESG